MHYSKEKLGEIWPAFAFNRELFFPAGLNFPHEYGNVIKRTEDWRR